MPRWRKQLAEQTPGADTDNTDTRTNIFNTIRNFLEKVHILENDNIHNLKALAPYLEKNCSCLNDEDKAYIAEIQLMIKDIIAELKGMVFQVYGMEKEVSDYINT
jgi:elongation factor P--beta-lysine ligase